MIKYLRGWRIVRKMENAQGIALLKIRCRDDWYFGFILLEPDYSNFFFGYFKRGWDHAR